jgi:hypothetical protein
VKIQTIKNVVTSKFGRQVLKVRKNSPTLMFAAGVVGVVGTAILASRATYKLEDVLIETDEQLEKIRSAEVVGYSEDDRQKDIVLCYIKTGFKIVSLYAPAVVVGALSITALTGAHVTLTRRNVSLTAAYAALDKGFRRYRDRVIGELGTDKDREFRYEMEKRTIVEETNEGPVSREILQPGRASVYARFFEKGNKNWKYEHPYNAIFVQCMQNYANDLLRMNGHVFLNEVYDLLGIDRSREGAIVGWILNNPNGDNCIDFGIFERDAHSGMLFVTGNEPSILLDFNVDGVIWDQI